MSGVSSAFAHIPVVLEEEQATSENPYPIRDPITSMAYYDVIDSSQRVYSLTAKNNGEFYMGISVPKVSDTPQCKPTISLTNDKNFVMYEGIRKNAL